MVALIAEVDERRLFAPAGYHSMQAYCVGKLRLSEDAAAKRIHVARKARLFPAMLEALADGRVHLSGLKLLVPHLTSGNVDELLKAATHRTRSDIELMIAERYPQSESLALISALPSTERVPGTVPRSRPIVMDRSRNRPRGLLMLVRPTPNPPRRNMRGGSTVENVRLRCRAHNQLGAERVFGAWFMQAKRERRNREDAAARAAPRSRVENGPGEPHAMTNAANWESRAGTTPRTIGDAAVAG